MRNLSTCTLAAVLTAGALQLAAQPVAARQSGFIPVTVTEPYNRIVSGLHEETFVILENGSPRPITYFSNVDSPIALAIYQRVAAPDTRHAQARR
jgi:hypothetical protein